MSRHFEPVKAKKSLGQHFLRDSSIAQNIALAVKSNPITHFWIEVGPGTGMLTQFLQPLNADLTVIETDRESVAYLKKQAWFTSKLIEGDFLAIDFESFGTQKPISIIGNFPYNISSQIVFKAIDNRSKTHELIGMFQKEVAERIAAPPGSKTYGIISVLTQAYFDAEYLFTVGPEVFSPPPKVKSGVIRLIRNSVELLPCNEKLFVTVVKTAFNQRRKTMSNAMKSIMNGNLVNPIWASKRAEQLSVNDFIALTNEIENHTKKAD